jgi:hypothetical protein
MKDFYHAVSTPNGGSEQCRCSATSGCPGERMGEQQIHEAFPVSDFAALLLINVLYLLINVFYLQGPPPPHRGATGQISLLSLGISD